MAVITISATTIAENSTGEIATLECEGATSYRLIADPSVLEIFEVVGDRIVVKQGAVLDYETQISFSFEIEALDLNNEAVGLLSFTEDTPFRISNLNDNAPDMIRLDGGLSLNISEGTPAGSFIGALSATDADGDAIVGYELAEESNFFEVVDDNGTWKVRLKQGVDYETVAQRQHVLRITAKDDLNTSSVQEIVIDVTNGNDNAPTGITLSTASISESAQAGDIVGELSAIDADGDAIAGYSFAEESDFFEIAQVDGKWVVRLKAGVDYETASQREHTLQVTATDGVHTSEIGSIAITVTNENDNSPSDIRLDGKLSAEISEGTSTGSIVGVLSATDADGNPITRYELVEQSTSFEVVEVDGRWVVRLKAGLDYEAQPQHVIGITATDGVNKSVAQSITINVSNVNDNAPTGIVLSNTSISEGAKIGDAVGFLSATDADGDPITGYALLEPNAFFYLVNENGTWLIKLKAGVDYENVAHREHVLKLTATDGTRTSAVHDIIIKVVNANEAPTDILVQGGTIGDNAILDATVATLTVQDPDVGDQPTYTIVEDATGAVEYDHPYFGILGNEIVVKNDLSDASIEPMQVYVKVTDAKGLFYVKQVTLTVTPVNEAPEVNAAPVDVIDGSKGGTLVAVIDAMDPEGETLNYKLSTTSEQWFSLVNNNDGTWNVVVKQGVTLRSDRAAFQSFVVEVSDTAGNTTPETVFLNINENPESVDTFEFVEVAKDAPAGTLVGTLVGYDPYGEAVKYTLLDDSDKLFTLVKNANGTYSVVVKQGVTLDYDDDAYHSFTVRVSDGFNPLYEESFDLVFGSYAPRVTDAPPIIVKEGAGGYVAVARFTVTDPDDDPVDCILSPESEALFDLEDRGNGNYDIVVREGVRLDYENPAHRAVVRLIVSDGGNTVFKDFVVNLTDEVDVINGTAKADSLNGTAGRDIIKGLAGNDRLAGDTGNDTLSGGKGKDVMNGGGGQDAFVFDSKPNKKTNLDKVTDFSVVDDSIRLENKIFTKLGKKGSEAAPAQLKKSFFTIGDKAKDKNDYIVFNKKNGKLYYDVDGSGSKAAVEIATLSKKLAMTHKDFFVI